MLVFVNSVISMLQQDTRLAATTAILMIRKYSIRQFAGFRIASAKIV